MPTPIKPIHKNLIIKYNNTSKKFKFIDPDEVLILATNTEGEINPDGLPQIFVESQQKVVEDLLSQSIEITSLDGGNF
jgi:hypothetical protein